MGVSIYYTATRSTPLSADEQLAIEKAIARYSVEHLIDEYCRSEQGFNWQSFHVYDPEDNDPGVIFEGATGLPLNKPNSIEVGVRHWCKLLTEIRRHVPGCNWRVHVDDCDIAWNEATKSFDPDSI